MRKLLCAGFCLTLAVTAQGNPRFHYLLHCGGCHLPNGAGNPPDVPTLIGELGRIVAVEGGRDYLIRVPGVTQATIDDAALAEVLNWVLTEFIDETLPEDFDPYDAADARDGRSRALSNPLEHRARIWGSY